MKQVKLWMIAAILVISGATVLTSCSKDDDENQQNTWPVGQWIYEGQWLDYDNIDAVVLDVTASADGSSKAIIPYVRSTTNGLWYWYPSTDTYNIDLTTGNISFGGKTFAYKLTDTTLTLTIDGQQYPFRHTNDIKLDVKDYPPALSEK